MSVGIDALATVRDAVAIVCEVAADTVSETTSFASLNVDSLSRVSIADVIEASVNHGPSPLLHIDDASLGRFDSVGELVDYVSRQIR
jgi:acyl carrier protein